MNVLLIYPNCEGYGRIPLGVSLISACLKRAGHAVELFDLTFMMSKNIDNAMREEIGTAKKVDTVSYWGTVEGLDIYGELRKKLLEFKPRLIGISIIQNNYWVSVDLLRFIRKLSKAHIAAGGVFATVAPELLLKERLVDSIVIGEGEDTVPELAKAVEDGSGLDRISNMALLKDGRLLRTAIRPYVDLNKIPFQDFSIFDQRHFLKPFDGKMVRAGYFELTRGCPFSCTYCVNYFLNESLYSAETKHIRFKNVDYAIDEIRALNAQYNFNFIFFSDENLLVLPYKQLERFAKLWNTHIRLPFYLTTRVEVATEDKIRILKDMNCATVAFGIECGNEQFRRKVLMRMTTNRQIINAFNLCRKYGIRTTANNMFGFPFETEEFIFDTIKLNIQANPDSYSLSIFAPYLGTNLYDICVKEGYLKPGIPKRISIIDESILEMPQISKERIRELYFKFVKYVSGKIELPEKYMDTNVLLGAKRGVAVGE